MKRFKSCYYGFLVGDSLGVPVKFIPRETLLNNPVTDMLEYGSYDVPAGSWSDDGSLLMATMDSLVTKNGLNYEDMANKILDWLSYAKYTPADYVFDVGMGTLKAMENYRENKLALESGMSGVNYNGNSPLVRMVPLAFYAKEKKLSDAQLIDLASDVSSITHRHEISFIGCYMFLRYLIFLLEGYDKYVSYIKLKDLDYSDFDKENVYEYHRILEGDIINYPLSEISSSGYIVSTLEAVLWCVNNTDSYHESVIGAINLGEYTDTIAALTGAVTGIIYGYDEIPKRWINSLQKKDYVKQMCTVYQKFLSSLR